MDLLGHFEVSKLLGWDKRKTSTYIRRGVFPKPVHIVKATPLWTLDQILAYKDKKTLK